MSSSDPLTVEQIRALTYRQTHPDCTYAEAATAAGVTTRSLARWISQPRYRQLWESEGQRHSAIVGSLRRRGEVTALETLQRVAETGSREADQVDAAGKLLAHLDRVRATDQQAETAELYAAVLGEWRGRSATVLGLEAEVQGEARELPAAAEAEGEA